MSKSRQGLLREPGMKTAALITALVASTCLLLLWFLPRQSATPGDAAARNAAPRHSQGKVLTREVGKVAVFKYEIVNSFRHDPRAFTQGIQHDVRGGRHVFWESTGLNGRSTIREVDAASGEVLRTTAVPARWFAEGLTRVNDKLLQLTWRSNVLFEYDVDDFSRVSTRRTPLSDGWGITYDGTSLIVTDSSPQLYWLDPASLRITANKTITDGGRTVPWVNELEWIDGQVWGNVWQTQCLARIDPTTANVSAWIVLDGLVEQVHRDYPQHRGSIDVLNGIAWDQEAQRLYVTGKHWPVLYEIRLVDVSTDPAALVAARNRCIPQVFAI